MGQGTEQEKIFTFGEILRYFIHKWGGNCVYKFADDIGFSRTSVYGWIKGDRHPSIENLVILAEYFSDVNGMPFPAILTQLVYSHPLSIQVRTRKKK